MTRIKLDFNYHKALFATAEAQLDEAQYPIAIVTAQMAFEVRTELAFSRLIPLKVDLPVETVLALLQDRSFMERPVRDLWVQLTGDEIKAAPSWKAYHTHVERRNRLAHGREEWSSRREGVASVKAVRTMIQHVESVEKRVLGEAGS